MKKIDFHIHTISTGIEKQGVFSMETLLNHVNNNELDAIAITNHNIFDLGQYKEIVKSIKDCIVFPGIEVSVDGTHILVIASNSTNEIKKFNNEAKELIKRIKLGDITVEEFKNIFKNYKKYIIIPHYEKRPKINESTLQKLGNCVTAGEVKNQKGFIVTKKDLAKLVPVLFSDARMFEDAQESYNRYTYVDIDKIEIGILKEALKDRNRVHIVDNKLDDEFQVLSGRLSASDRLNLIIGKRSSGKTYVLKQIRDEFGCENVKFIEQFQLTKDSDEATFQGILRKIVEKDILEYSKEFNNLVRRVINIDYTCEEEIDKYITSLYDFANSQSRNNEFSKTRLYTETMFNQREDKDFAKLIDSVIYILKNKNHKKTIYSIISREKIIELLEKLLNEYLKDKTMMYIKNRTDEMINIIQNSLQFKSSIGRIDNIDFYELFKNYLYCEYFNEICKQMVEEKNIKTISIQKFKIKLSRGRFNGAEEMKHYVNIKMAISSAMSLYNGKKFYKFIRECVNLGIDIETVSKMIFVIRVQAINNNDVELSGGEKAEFNLLAEINDAKNYDLLIIDEPEASFDNIFIRNDLIKLLKDLSETIPVFISTHNNTLGMLMKPNKIILTINDNGEYKVYSGDFGQKELKSASGDLIDSYGEVIDLMEAGEEAYKDKGDTYESFKN